MIAIIKNVPTELTEEDKFTFKAIGLIESSSPPVRYIDQIEIIKIIQTKHFKMVPNYIGIEEYSKREPADLIKLERGLCFDRSRFFDKAFKYVGFETRHVFLLYPDGKSFISAITTSKQLSHAITEVKTSRGWMVVDSNSPWIGINDDLEPFTSKKLNKDKSLHPKRPPIFEKEFYSIRGLYSRKGQFYGPKIFFPDINWHDFIIYNFIITE
jgi:hypothetical protein